MSTSGPGSNRLMTSTFFCDIVRAVSRSQTARERQEDAAARLNDAVIEIATGCPRGQMDRREASEPLLKAHRALIDAWSRSGVLTDHEIRERFRALDMAMFIASQDTRDPR